MNTDLMVQKRRPVKPLPEEIVRRIAAGEVIVRPASVIKELIENAIDAAASKISVEVKAGGKNLIRVVDDGMGMTRDDVRLAITRHATSKLESVDDLTRISSYGFRGEALAAIAAVSRLTIETNTDEREPGTKIEVEAGEVLEIAEAVRVPGTTVTVRMLFFNLPVRRAFLKSENYELRLIVDVFRSYALAYPKIAFELTSNDRTLVKLPAVDSLRERLIAIYSRQIADAMIEFNFDHPSISVHGFLTEHSQLKSFYDVQMVYFNHRPVRSQVVTKAIYDGYGPLLSGRHPNFIIFLETDPSRLDVNIHPTKQEVRFADERFLFDFVSEAVHNTLGTHRREQLPAQEILAPDSLLGEDRTVVDFWQLHNSYIFAQVASGYVIVDQHAAHERILYEEVKRRRQSSFSQSLLFPITLELSVDEFDAFESFQEQLATMGLVTKIFSGRTVVVEGVPSGSYLGRDELREFFNELVNISSKKVDIEDELAKLIACKGAIKAGQRLRPEEMQSLINRLFLCAEPYFCPHGRPAIIKITLEDLERRFGRI
jgi:DNA mismatch repair protein MutL